MTGRASDAFRRVTRLGAVSYLNTRPLVYGLDERSDVLLRFDVPARCADLLEGGLIDLGLIPAFEYARHADYAIVPGLAIASHGRVDSVALFTRRPMEDVRSIALDVSSRTSANLVRILCARHYRIEPVFRPASPNLEIMLAGHDAALVIGDPALFGDPDALGATKIDLGEVWAQMTGLPFVWAFWSGRPGAAPRDVCRTLRDARDRGVAAVDEIGRREAPGDPLRAQRITTYLRDSISYALEGPLVAGLRTYFELLADQQLIERAPDVRLFEV